MGILAHIFGAYYLKSMIFKYLKESFMKKVTVVIPCYNDGKYIEESIQSVLNQTYSNIEIIVVDDGSTDFFTKKVLSEQSWERTKVIYSTNKGPAAARNLGIEQGSGTYILPLDADDYIAPTYIAKAVQALEEDENRGIVYCRAAFFDKQRGEWDLPPYTLRRMLVDNVIFVTALFRKQDWITVGGFDAHIKGGMEDYDFWLSLIELGREVYQLQEVLFYYRKKKESRTTLFHQEREAVGQTYQYIYEKHTQLYELHRSEYAMAMREEWISHMLFKQKIKQRLGVVGKIINIPFIKRRLREK